jgi:hypothetical protein
MEPVTLATAAIGLLVPFLKSFGGKVLERVGDAASDRVFALYERIKRRLSGDDYDEQLLIGVEKDSESESRQRNLGDRLAELLANDPEFARDIKELVSSAREAGAPITAVNTGIVAGGNVVQGAGKDAVGRDKIIGTPRSGSGRR